MKKSKKPISYKLICFVLAISLLLPVGVTAGLVGASAGAQSRPDFAAEVLRLVNLERTSRGLTALLPHCTLDQIANIRSEELVTHQGHNSPNGNHWSVLLSEHNVTYDGARGENIAWGSLTPEEVMFGMPEWPGSGWMNSDGHRGNILYSRYTHIGIGVFYDPLSEWGFYWTQIFVRNPSPPSDDCTPTTNGPGNECECGIADCDVETCRCDDDCDITCECGITDCNVDTCRCDDDCDITCECGITDCNVDTCTCDDDCDITCECGIADCDIDTCTCDDDCDVTCECGITDCNVDTCTCDDDCDVTCECGITDCDVDTCTCDDDCDNNNNNGGTGTRPRPPGGTGNVTTTSPDDTTTGPPGNGTTTGPGGDTAGGNNNTNIPSWLLPALGVAGLVGGLTIGGISLAAIGAAITATIMGGVALVAGLFMLGNSGSGTCTTNCPPAAPQVPATTQAPATTQPTTTQPATTTSQTTAPGATTQPADETTTQVAGGVGNVGTEPPPATGDFQTILLSLLALLATTGTAAIVLKKKLRKLSHNLPIYNWNARENPWATALAAE